MEARSIWGPYRDIKGNGMKPQLGVYGGLGRIV